MFPHVSNPQINTLVQATAGAMYKGAELQNDRDAKTERDKQLTFIVYKKQKLDEVRKPNGANGRLA